MILSLRNPAIIKALVSLYLFYECWFAGLTGPEEKEPVGCTIDLKQWKTG